jgi:membrane-associated phospholipid phosphatase
LKLFIVRYRPAHFFPEYAQSLSETWIGVTPGGALNFEYVTQSFPSAHAATAVGLATGLIWMLPKCRNLFVGLALVASLQRIVAGAHWLSDVFAGAAVAVMVCGLIFHDRRMNMLFGKLEKGSQPNEPIGDSTLQLAKDEDIEHSKAA